jgi:hypothetical protein
MDRAFKHYWYFDYGRVVPLIQALHAERQLCASTAMASASLSNPPYFETAASIPPSPVSIR